jgi:hypothetical protein
MGQAACAPWAAGEANTMRACRHTLRHAAAVQPGFDHGAGSASCATGPGAVPCTSASCAVQCEQACRHPPRSHAETGWGQAACAPWAAGKVQGGGRAGPAGAAGARPAGGAAARPRAPWDPRCRCRWLRTRAHPHPPGPPRACSTRKPARRRRHGMAKRPLGTEPWHRQTQRCGTRSAPSS